MLHVPGRYVSGPQTAQGNTLVPLGLMEWVAPLKEEPGGDADVARGSSLRASLHT